MKTRLLVCLLSLLPSVVGLRAQTFPYDHVHFGVPDQAKAVEWYVTNLGARRGAAADRVVFGRTIFAFARAEAAPPSAGGAIDHVGSR
jgi:hypothetical protein